MSGRRVITFAALLGAVGAFLGWTRSQQAGSASGATPVSIERRAERNLALAGMGVRTGGRWVSHASRRAFADTERREELDRSFELATAEDVAEALGQMKGAMMKLGQMASYLDQGLPEHVRAVLAQLQADAPPMSAELASGVVRSELGAAPEEIFAEWDPVPIAAASIGQVHRAITHDGLAVAVKVQYPGIAEAMTSDLANADLLFGALGGMFPGMDSKPLVAELKERLVEELDYEIEASNQRHFAEHYRGHPHVVVPEVVGEFCSRRVLTTELAEGVSFAEMLEWSEEERNLAGETIYRFVFRSIYKVGAFNGDPHPGNYRFQGGGRVVFLDYGLVKRFTVEEVQLFEDLIRLMVLERDASGFRSLVEAAGLLKPAPEISDTDVAEFFAPFYELVMEDETVEVTKEYASALVRQVFDTSDGDVRPIQKHANVPPAFVVSQRINLGLYAVLGDLGATANWRKIAEEIWPFVETEPQTELGWAALEWERRHSAAQS